MKIILMFREDKSMKRKLFAICFAFLLVFSVSCGGGGDGYGDYGDSGDSGDSGEKPDKDNDTAPDTGDSGTVSDQDVPDTAQEQDAETPDEDGTEIPDEGPVEETGSCFDILACINNCPAGDSGCVSSCYNIGNDEGQADYRAWRNCYNAACEGFESWNLECSTENCPDETAKCDLEAAMNSKVEYPAPYGTLKIAAEYDAMIYDEPNDQGDEAFVLMESYAKGKLSTMDIGKGTTISFVHNYVGSDGEWIEVFQAPFNYSTMTSGTPAVMLRFRKTKIAVGETALKVGFDGDALLIVVDIDKSGNIKCYHAFGAGSVKIEELNIVWNTPGGRLKISSGDIELFSPRNVPELGGDARAVLGVEACQLIK